MYKLLYETLQTITELFKNLNEWECSLYLQTLKLIAYIINSFYINL